MGNPERMLPARTPRAGLCGVDAQAPVWRGSVRAAGCPQQSPGTRAARRPARRSDVGPNPAASGSILGTIPRRTKGVSFLLKMGLHLDGKAKLRHPAPALAPHQLGDLGQVPGRLEASVSRRSRSHRALGFGEGRWCARACRGLSTRLLVTASASAGSPSAPAWLPSMKPIPSCRPPHALELGHVGPVS